MLAFFYAVFNFISKVNALIKAFALNKYANNPLHNHILKTNLIKIKIRFHPLCSNYKIKKF